MNLLQEKLDVLDKKRSNFFNWRGQFTPQFVEYIIDNFAKQGDFILDPFSGSGTVLLEAAERNIKAVGFEINPAAYAMSKFFSFCNLKYSERLVFCDKFEKRLNGVVDRIGDRKLYTKDSNYRMSYANLLYFALEFNKGLSSNLDRILLLNILFQSEKDKNLTLAESITKSFSFFKDKIISIPYTEMLIDSMLKDSRCVGDEYINEVDLIFTSPPYINVFNYHQNYRAIVESFNFNLLKVAHSEFGSNRKNRGNRFKTVIQYCIDMEMAIRSFWIALKPNAKIILVLGRESNVRGTPFYNGRIIIDILEKTEGFSNIEVLERKFTNKFGSNIKEDIIVATKANSINYQNLGKTIALEHLRHALKTCQNNVKEELIEAIESIENINPSPLFNYKYVLKDEQYTT